jgi:hypothetical protein
LLASLFARAYSYSVNFVNIVCPTPPSDLSVGQATFFVAHLPLRKGGGKTEQSEVRWGGRTRKTQLCKKKVFLVIRAAEPHPVPSRTRSLSPPAPMILPGQPGGNVGHRQKILFLLPSTHPSLCLLSPFSGKEIIKPNPKKTWRVLLFDVILVIDPRLKSG